MSWIEIDFEKIPDNLLKGNNIIYGAGGNGERAYYRMKENKIPVKGFYDDDFSRWGEIVYDNKRIYSFPEIIGMDREKTNYILASECICEIEKRAQKNGLKNLYGVYDLILQHDEEVFQVSKLKGNQDYIQRLSKIKESFSDRESEKYFDLMYETVIRGELLHNIKNIFCTEEMYFLKDFDSFLQNATFVDCGAFKGDTLSRFIEKYPKYNSVYCFEADKTNFCALQAYIKSLGKDNIKCENYALWDIETMIGMEGSGMSTRVSQTTANMCPTMTLDRYFSNIKVDYIKMDIEGAELKALRGGLNIIKRDRPVLAISIYHTMNDRLEIPELLISSLVNYEFMIRHHGYTYCDSIIYCMPKEKVFIK